MLNEQLVKGSKTIKIDQVFALKHGAFWRTYKILNLPKGRLGAKLVPEYLTETTSKQILDQITAIESANRQNRIDGFIGRPTKKNRRDLDKFSDWLVVNVSVTKG